MNATSPLTSRSLLQKRVLTTRQEVGIFLISILLLGVVGLLIGQIVGFNVINHPIPVVGDHAVSFEPYSNDLVEVQGSDMQAEISCVCQFKLVGITGKPTYPSVAMHLAKVVSDYDNASGNYGLYSGPIEAGTYQIQSPDYWSFKKGMPFDITGSGPISVMLTRSGYYVPFGQEGAWLITAIGGVVGIVCGLIVGLYVRNYLTRVRAVDV